MLENVVLAVVQDYSSSLVARLLESPLDVAICIEAKMVGSRAPDSPSGRLSSFPGPGATDTYERFNFLRWFASSRS